MPPRTWHFRVHDILQAIERIDRYVADLDEASFLGNELIGDAVIRNLQIVGEAAASVPEAIRQLHPEVDWHRMRGMRNLIVHEYYRVDLEIVWTTVQEDLPIARKQLQGLLEAEGAE